jgi:hypothetical protein
LKRKSLALIGIFIVISGAVGFFFYSYAFTTSGIPPGICPEFSLVASLPNAHIKLFAVAKPTQPYQGSGSISWCIYGENDLLARSYQTNRILDTPVASSDGAYVAAPGFQVAPGPAGLYENGAVYLFDSSGRMLWSVSDPRGFFTSLIDSNGSVIIGNDPDLYYINNQGKVLWNYSNPNEESTGVALVDDGAYVVDGISGVPFPNSSMYGSSLVLFNSTGGTVWNDSIPNQIIDSTGSLAFLNGQIALGVSVSGYQGTLFCYNLQGQMVWSKPVDSAILNVKFQNNGTTIYAETNWGHVVFDTNGNLVENETAPH